MQFINKEQRRKKIKLDQGREAGKYPHSLQFYGIPPTENISLQEFEQYAVERLKVLKSVENVGIKHIKGSSDWKDHMAREFHNHKKNGILKSLTDVKLCNTIELDNEAYDERKKDHISHFILRLAYCRSEDLRRWFISQELDMFRYRFSLETDASIKQFLDLNKLNYTPISADEKKNVLKELIDSCANIKSVQVDSENFYKVPFTEALDLVRGRKVYLRDGLAYVPQSELVVIILSHFRVSISHALAMTARALPNLEEDDRLVPMLSTLSKRYLGADYNVKKNMVGTVTADMLDGLSKKDYPLCMQNIHQSIKQNHHCKHWSRQQYGLFLKGIGLSLEEAVKFWRSEFTKLIDVDKFDKQYAYNIRHNYGKEGNRTNYTPYSCIKIITTNAPQAGDAHGCPFRHSDVDLLRQKIQNMGVTKTDASDVSDLAKRGHYQLACARYFEVTHNLDKDTISINHPNEYFNLSRKPVVKNEGTPNTQNRGTPRIVKIQSQSDSTQASTQASTQMDDGDDDFLSQVDMESLQEIKS